MSPAPDTPETLIAQAQALIDQVQSDLAASEDFLRDQGINPEKLTAYMQSLLTDEGRQQAQHALQTDMDAVEQEVREEAVRRSFSRPAASTGGVRRRRPMV